MDFQEARTRRESSLPGPGGERRTSTRERAADARLRRAIREAFARQRIAVEEDVDPTPMKTRLHVVRDPRA